MPLIMKRGKQAVYNRKRALQLFRRAAGEGPLDHDKLIKAFERLDKRYAPSYVSLIYRVCRAEYSWFPKDVKYRNDSVVTLPTLDEGSIASMIRAMNCMVLHPDVRARFFLATVYGLRRVEIGSIDNSCIDIRRRSLLVSTAKGGVSRYHLIPECGVSILSSKLTGVSVRAMTSDWQFMERSAGIEHSDGFGWHSVRRSLVTRLTENGLDPIMIKKFMRWKESDMFEHYVNFDFRAADAAVFEAHPFLKYWEVAQCRSRQTSAKLSQASA